MFCVENVLIISQQKTINKEQIKNKKVIKFSLGHYGYEGSNNRVPKKNTQDLNISEMFIEDYFICNHTLH